MSSTKSRQDTRAVVALVARYRSPATFEYVQDACCDVSIGGMFIKSQSPAAAGTLIKLECETDSTGVKIRGVGRVVWLRQEPNEHGPTGMGVKFVKLEPGSKEAIAQLVQRLSDAGIEAKSISAPPEAAVVQIARRGGGSPLPPTTKSSTPAASPAGDNGSPASSDRPTMTTAVAVRASNKPVSTTAPATQTKGVGTPSPAPQAEPVSAPSPALRAKPASTPFPAAPAKSASTPAPVSTPATDVQNDAQQPSVVDTNVAEPPAAADREAAATSSIAPSAATAMPGKTATAGEVSPPLPRTGTAWRIWLGVAACVAVLLTIVLADDGPPPAPPTAPAATPQEAVAPPTPAPAAAEPTNVPSRPAPTPTPAATPTIIDSPAAIPTTAAPSAAQAPGAEPAVADAKPEPEAAPPPAPTGKLAGQYIVDFVSRPAGATITIGEQSIVAPGEMNLGSLPARVRVLAAKSGYQSSSAWIDRSGFERINGNLRRQVYMTLPAEGAAPKPPRTP